jgi:hypothetical protein
LKHFLNSTVRHVIRVFRMPLKQDRHCMHKNGAIWGSDNFRLMGLSTAMCSYTVASIGANSSDSDNIAKTKDICSVLLWLLHKKVLSLSVAMVHKLD